MTKLDNWDEFTEKTKALYDADPIGCRVTLKYRHNDGKLNLKVTDNKKVYQYTAEHSKEVKNVDKFLSTYMRIMPQ